MLKCPYCHREIQDNEKYCFFCEQDLTKVWDEVEKEQFSTDEPETTLVDDIKKAGKTLKKYSEAAKKKAEEMKQNKKESFIDKIKKKIKKK